MALNKPYRSIKFLRIKKMSYDDLNINFTTLTVKIIDRLYDGIHTSEIDELTAQQCASLSTTHPRLRYTSQRILISNHQNTTDSFTTVINNYIIILITHDKHSPLISEQLYKLVNQHSNTIQIGSIGAFSIGLFRFQNLRTAYLMKINGVIVEPTYVDASFFRNTWRRSKKSKTYLRFNE